MSYTITAAQYADEANTSVVVQTVEAGAVAINQQDRPVLWQMLQDWVGLGNAIDPFPVQPAPAESAIAEAKAVYDTGLGLGGSLGRSLRAIVGLLIERFNFLHDDVVAVANFTWDPANLANGAGVTSPNAPVAGAAFGDFVLVAAPYSLQGITCTGFVSAAGQVAVRLQNQTGGSINLASGSWKVVVWRPTELPQITLIQARDAFRDKLDANT